MMMMMPHSEDDNEMIVVIAEQLTNEFPAIKIPDVMGKAKRLYAVMKLEKSIEEMQRDRVVEDLEKL